MREAAPVVKLLEWEKKGKILGRKKRKLIKLRQNPYMSMIEEKIWKEKFSVNPIKIDPITLPLSTCVPVYITLRFDIKEKS